MIMPHFIAWALNEFILSFLLFLAYQGMKQLNFRSEERYLFLKVAFLILPFIPFLAPIFHADFLSHGQIVAVLHSSVPSSVDPLENLHELQGASAGLLWLVRSLIAFYFSVVSFKIFKMIKSTLWVKKISREGECLTKWPTLPIILHDHSFPPATVGVIDPMILISRKVYQALSETQLKLIIDHETGHIRRQDFFFNLLRLSIGTFIFYSPFISILSNAFEEEMELSCDERLMQDSEFNRKEYGELLFALSTNAGFKNDLIYNGFFNAKPFINRRIQAMKDFKTIQSKAPFVYSILVTFLIVSAYSVSALEMDSKTAVELHTQNEKIEIISNDYCTAHTCSPEFTHFMAAAAKGDGAAENKVGELLLFGSFIQQDFISARYWFLKSSEHGNAVAPNHLGRLYLNGEGVTKNTEEACKWYTLSAERGDSTGKENANWCRIHANSGFTPTSVNPKSLFTLEMNLSMNGRVVSSPRVSVKEGEMAGITDQTANEKYFIDMIAREGTMQGHAGILIKFDVGTIDSQGVKKRISSPSVLVKENSPATITWSEDHGSADAFSLSVVAKKTAL